MTPGTTALRVRLRLQNRGHDSRGDDLDDVDTKELFPSHNNQILLLGIDLVWLLFPFYFWLRLDPIVTLRLVWLS